MELPKPEAVLKGWQGFAQQAAAVLAGVRLAREDVEDLNRLFRDLEATLRMQWPGCKIHPFGSVVTGLGIKTSDADCYVEVQRHNVIPKKFVIIAKQILMRQPHIFHKLFAITGARVPILQFFHAPTRRHCDLSFSSLQGVKNSYLIKSIMGSDERILSLSVILKYWSKVHTLCGTNLLPNYALIMMIIFYLQQVQLVPPIAQLQHEEVPKDFLNGWNMNFDDCLLRSTSSNNISLEELLIGFFKYYRDFNYEEDVISPYIGRPIAKKRFEVLNSVSEEFPLYVSNVTQLECAPLRAEGPLVVQDALEHARNCAGGVHARLLLRLRRHVELAAALPPAGDFLRQLLTRRPPDAPHVSQQIQFRKNMGKPKKVKKRIGQIKT